MGPAGYETIASQEEIYLEATEEEIRTSLVSDEQSPPRTTIEYWHSKIEKLELDWEYLFTEPVAVFARLRFGAGANAEAFGSHLRWKMLRDRSHRRPNSAIHRAARAWDL